MTITTIITMTMTITVIVGPETGIDHTTEIDRDYYKDDYRNN